MTAMRETQATLIRTSVQPALLALVRDGRIEWRSWIGCNGGFARVGSDVPFTPGHELVALYELRNHGQIKVDVNNGRVSITSIGMSRLADWAH